MVLDGARSRFASSLRGGFSSTRDGLRGAGQSFLTPGFLQGPVAAASRLGQWFAAFLLPVIVPISLTMIVLIYRIITNLVFGLSPLAERDGTPFALTLFGLALVVAGGWFWFQWVRTAGFGLTNIDFGGSG